MDNGTGVVTGACGHVVWRPEGCRLCELLSTTSQEIRWDDDEMNERDLNHHLHSNAWDSVTLYEHGSSPWNGNEDEANATIFRMTMAELREIAPTTADRQVLARLVDPNPEGGFILDANVDAVMFEVRNDYGRECVERALEMRRRPKVVGDNWIGPLFGHTRTEVDAAIARITEHGGMGDIVLALNDAIGELSIRDVLGITIVPEVLRFSAER